MKRVFETAECEAVRNSIFWELRYEKHENQMKGFAMEPKVYYTIMIIQCYN